MLEYALLAAGIVLLVKGADFLVDGSSSLARRMKVPSLVIGLTIVAFGTSMPELVVNVIAAFGGKGGVAFGNVIGSNIANTLLILGAASVIMCLKMQHSTTWKEIPFSLLAALVILVFVSAPVLDGLDLGYIYRFEGVVLLSFFAIYMYYVLEMAVKNKGHMEDEKMKIKKMSPPRILAYIAGGMAALYLGGVWTVGGAVTIARLAGVSEYFISLTIVAVGTSLPELFTSVTAALRKDADLAVGNVVGSNIFNIFWILGITSVITPIAIPAFAAADLAILLAVTAMLFLFMFVGRKHELERWQGTVFVAMYASYIIYLVFRG